MVGDQGGGGLLGVELELLRECDADALGVEKGPDLDLVLQTGAGGVAEAVAGAAVVLPEKLLSVAGSLRRDERAAVA